MFLQLNHQKLDAYSFSKAFARGSIIEIDAALDIASDLNYLKNLELNKLGELMVAELLKY